MEPYAYGDIKSLTVKSTFEGHKGWIRSLKFPPDGKMIATGSYDKTVHLWNVISEDHNQVSLEHKDYVWSVNFSPDGKSLASGSSDKTARIWDIDSGRVIHTLTGYKNWICSVCFSPDGKILATGSYDKTVCLWDVNSGTALHTYKGHQGKVWAVTFSPYEDIIASASADRTIHLWDKNKTIKILDNHKGSVMSLCFSPINKRILASGSVDQTIRIWDIANGKTIRLLEGHKGEIWSVTFSHDGKMLAGASADQTVRIWDVKTGEYIELYDHLGPVSSVKFAPNMKYPVTTGAAGRLEFWDFEKKKPFLYRYCFEPGAWLDLLPNGYFNASPEGIRYLCYTEKGTLNSYSAEELIKVFFNPEEVRETIKKYIS
ncbi:MAG: WD40 repeat domain-containing protein [bacterium]